MHCQKNYTQTDTVATCIYLFICSIFFITRLQGLLQYAITVRVEVIDCVRVTSGVLLSHLPKIFSYQFIDDELRGGDVQVDHH